MSRCACLTADQVPTCRCSALGGAHGDWEPPPLREVELIQIVEELGDKDLALFSLFIGCAAKEDRSMAVVRPVPMGPST